MIPLSEPVLGGNEWRYIKECIDTNWVSSVGKYVDRFEAMLAEMTGVRHAVATSNGTAALHIALLCAGVSRDEWVILPNLTFVASANPITYQGALPLLCDVDPATWQLDVAMLDRFLRQETERSADGTYFEGKRVAAVMPVHILGGMVDMPALNALATEFSLTVIEDATESLGSTLDGKAAGTLSFMGCLSFNGNKIVTTGGGGAILIDDPDLAKNAKHLTTQAKASTNEYFHDMTGYNYRLVNILAALGVAQLEQLPVFLEKRRHITDRYVSAFGPSPAIRLQKNIAGCHPNNWLNTIYAPEAPSLIKRLAEHDIQARPLWVPMNRLPMYKASPYITLDDVAGDLYAHCVSLPSSSNLTDDQVSRVINVVLEAMPAA